MLVRDLERVILDWGSLVAHCHQHQDTDVRCQYALGQCHKTGKGVAKDDAEAVRLFRLAASKAYLPAQSWVCQPARWRWKSGAAKEGHASNNIYTPRRVPHNQSRGSANSFASLMEYGLG